VVNLANPFDDKRLNKAKSALIKIIPDDQGRYEFELIAQYTRLGLNSLQVGDLIGVQNYSMSGNGNGTYSILSLTQVLPVHFAIQGQNAYPGHTFISMKSIKEDWETQIDEAHYATTTISCKAVPTGWQFNHNPLEEDLPIIVEETSLPMVGAEIRPLGKEMVDKIINQGIDKESTSPLYHKKFEDIQLRLDKKALLTTHFGVFGFTGVGKSNFVSSLIHSMNKHSDSKPNVIIIDPNDEYIGLFIDLFTEVDCKIKYLNVGIDSLPDQIIKKLGTDNFSEEDVNLFYKQLHLPHELKAKRELQPFIKEKVKHVLSNTFIALIGKDVGSLIKNTVKENISQKTGYDTKTAIGLFVEKWVENYESEKIVAKTLISAILKGEQLKYEQVFISELNTKDKQATANNVISWALKSLRSLSKKLSEIPQNAILSNETLISELNNTGQSQILIISGHKVLELKQFSSELGNELYESRRKQAVLEPFTLFFLDEADLFIPLSDNEEETILMKEMCITLARRGRKFGLGIGIATQRVSMLDTQIMGNLHTYFISRLPRKYDRDTVAEAFGVGEEELSPTFTFKAGNWLVLSHDATGLKGVPIPTKAVNANERIIKAAENDKIQKG